MGGNHRTRDIVITALLTALVFVFTQFLNIRLPISVNGGLFHLGTVMVVIVGIVFGKKKCAVASAVGMALFDLLGPWAIWAPFTFVVRGVSGYLLGYISHTKNNGNHWVTNVVAVVASGLCMMVGYYITEVILYHNFVTPLTSIPGNMMQVVISGVIGLPAAMVLKRYPQFR